MEEGELSKRALDEMAIALKEVAAEARRAEAELGVAKAELEHSRGEEERLKEAVRLQAAECERLSNMAHRLRAEADDTLMAWSHKERGLVECLRRAEQDNARLRDLLKVANEAAQSAIAENASLREEPHTSILDDFDGDSSLSLPNPKKRALLRRFGDLLLVRRRPLHSNP